jgi:hypothetical protein
VSRTTDDLIADAAHLPLRDAAYAIWRQKSTFERLEGRVWPPRDYSTPEAADKSRQASFAQIKYEREFAQDGPSFDRLRCAHPHASDAELKAAIIAAVKFDDDCLDIFHTAAVATTWKTCRVQWRRPRGTIRPIWRPPTAMPKTGSPTI